MHAQATFMGRPSIDKSSDEDEFAFESEGLRTHSTVCLKNDQFLSTKTWPAQSVKPELPLKLNFE